MFLTGFLTGLAANLLSLLEATMGRVRRVRALFNSPGFLVGDFLIIPVYFGLAFVFLAKFATEINIGLMELAGAGAISLVVVVIMGQVFRLIKPNWIPHGLVAWLVVFIFMIIALVVRQKPGEWPFLLGLGLLLVLNQAVGIVYPKKL